jgi:hypothetical protein
MFVSNQLWNKNQLFIGQHSFEIMK